MSIDGAAYSIVVANPNKYDPSIPVLTNKSALNSISSIAYNGTVWLIVGSITEETKIVKTFQNVMESFANIQLYKQNMYKYAVIKAEYDRILFNNPTGTFNTTVIANATTNYNSSVIAYNNAVAASQTLFTSTDATKETTGAQSNDYYYYTGHTIAISVDGYNWNRIDMNPFASTNEYFANANAYDVTSRISGVAWNGTLWIAIGSGGGVGYVPNNLNTNAVIVPSIITGNNTNTYIENQIATSPDGINWTPRGIPGMSSTIATGETFSSPICYPYGIASTPSVTLVVCGNISNAPNYSTYYGNFYYSPFDDLVPTICKSTDGINWKKIGNSGEPSTTGKKYGYDSVGGLFQGYSVGYNGAYWVAVGSGLPYATNSLYVSSGQAIDQRSTIVTRTINSCIAISSNNGETWSQGLPNGVNNNSSGVPQNYYTLFDVAWNGTYWLAVGQITDDNHHIPINNAYGGGYDPNVILNDGTFKHPHTNLYIAKKTDYKQAVGFGLKITNGGLGYLSNVINYATIKFMNNNTTFLCTCQIDTNGSVMALNIQNTIAFNIALAALFDTSNDDTPASIQVLINPPTTDGIRAEATYLMYGVKNDVVATYSGGGLTSPISVNVKSVNGIMRSIPLPLNVTFTSLPTITLSSTNEATSFAGLLFNSNGNAYYFFTVSLMQPFTGDGIIVKSTNSIDWTVTSGFPFFTSIIWDGNYWVSTGDTVTKRSRDGVNWDVVGGAGTDIASKIALPILGGTIKTVNSLFVGYGNPMSIIRSYNDSIWFDHVTNNLSTNFVGEVQKEFYGVVWTGSYWIVVGDALAGTSCQSLSISTDGITWTYPLTLLDTGRDVAWNGTMAVAVGEGTTKLITSTNLTVWTARSPFQLLRCECVAWNGTHWVVGGEGGINYSTDGITWLPANTCPLNYVNGLAWNGYYWVACGNGPTHVFALSKDSINWFAADPATKPFTIQGSRIAWNKSMWVAVGSGTNPIARSIDGYTWIPVETNLFSSGTEIAWTGTKWITSGFGYGSIAISDDGIMWTNISTGLARGRNYATKDVTLPYSGTSNSTVLTASNAILSLLDGSTSAKIASDLAIAQLAADAEAAAAAAAAELLVRNGKKALANSYKTEILFWQTTINAHYTQLLDSTYIELSSDYDTAFLFVKNTYDLVNYSKEIVDLYYSQIYTDSNDIATITDNTNLLLGLLTEIQGKLINYYNYTRQLYIQLIDAKHTYFSTRFDGFITLLNGWGYPTTNQSLPNYNTELPYNAIVLSSSQIVEIYTILQNAYNSARTTALTTFNTAITTASSTTNAPNYTVIYTTVKNVDVLLAAMYNNYMNVYTNYKSVADKIRTDTLSISSNWSSITGVSYISTINSEFTTVYNTYFTKVLRTNTHPSYQSQNNTQNALSIASPFMNDITFVYRYRSTPHVTTAPINYYINGINRCKYLLEKYSHIGGYPTALTVLNTTLTTKMNTMNAVRQSAIAYATNLSKTTLRTKINDFKTVTRTRYVDTAFQIDSLVSTILKTTFYSNSNYVKAATLVFNITNGIALFPQLFPLLQAVTLADLKAAEDLCIPPKTGWGGNTSNLTLAETGDTGISSDWDVAFNPPSYTRRALANFLGLNPVSPKFIEFTTTETYMSLTQKIEDFNNAIDEVNGYNGFTTTYANTVLSADLAIIESQYVPIATAYLQSLSTKVTAVLPSSQELIDYGYVTYDSTRTFAQIVATVQTSFNELQTLLNTSIVGYTPTQINTFLTTVETSISSINTIQTSDRYQQIFYGITRYNEVYTNTNNYVSMMQSRINKWLHMKDRALKLSQPISDTTLSEEGNTFIVSIVPTNTTYWVPRQFTTFFNLTTGLQEECYLSGNTILALPPSNPANYETYSSTASYYINQTAKYNNLVYQCILDNTIPSSTGLLNIDVSDTTRWKLRVYPYVTYNGNFVEGDLTTLAKLNITDYSPYLATSTYYLGDIVRGLSDTIYCCIADFRTINYISNIDVTNTKYWTPCTYPIGYVNGNRVELNPATYPILNINNIPAYSATTTYKTEDYVSYNGQIFILVSADRNGTTQITLSDRPPGSIGIADLFNAKWQATQYTYALYQPPGSTDAEYYQITSYYFSPLNIANYQTYSATKNEINPRTNVTSIVPQKYKNRDFVKYNGIIYQCLFTGSSIINIPLENTFFWKQILFPMVFYDGNFIEAIPGIIKPIALDTVSAYSSTTTYNIENLVSSNGSIYECINDSEPQVPITNIVPTNTTHWVHIPYPFIFIPSIGSVIADPASGYFQQENPLNHHDYDNNWLYIDGDLTSYNGVVYQCINTVPPDSPEAVVNIPPQNSSYWERKTDIVTEYVYTNGSVSSILGYIETQYFRPNNITYWTFLNGKSYAKGTLIVWNGDIYQAESTVIYPVYNQSELSNPATIAFMTPLLPHLNLLIWNKIDFTTLKTPIPTLYSNTGKYYVGTSVTMRVPFDNNNMINFGLEGLFDINRFALQVYTCISLDPTAPIEYKYDDLVALEDNSTAVYKGTDRLNNVARYGDSLNDPFKIPNFDVTLRRYVIMNIEMPYAYANNTIADFVSNVLNSNYFYTNYSLLDIKPITAVASYNALIASANASIVLFDNSEITVSINKLISLMYAYPKATLLAIFERIVYNINAINRIKQQYFSSPGLQLKILQNPYKYINPIGMAATPPKKLFKDLGVGDIDEITYNLDVQHNALYSTEYDRNYYYDSTEIISKYLTEVAVWTQQAKDLIGYTIFACMSNIDSNTGARFFLSVPNLYQSFYSNYTIDTPIVEHDGVARHSELMGTTLDPRIINLTIVKDRATIYELQNYQFEIYTGDSFYVKNGTIDRTNLTQSQINELDATENHLFEMVRDAKRNKDTPWLTSPGWVDKGYFEDPVDGFSMIGIVNAIVAESIRPPAYTLAGNQATRDLDSITYVSKDPVVKGIGMFAKGLVGTFVAVFQSMYDPSQVAGMLSVIPGLDTSFIPSFSFPDFNSTAGNINLLKNQIAVLRSQIKTTPPLDSEVDLQTYRRLVLYFQRTNNEEIAAAKEMKKQNQKALRKNITPAPRGLTPLQSFPQRPRNYVPSSPDAIRPERRMTPEINLKNLIKEQKQLAALQQKIQTDIAAVQKKPIPTFVRSSIPAAIYSKRPDVDPSVHPVSRQLTDAELLSNIKAKNALRPGSILTSTDLQSQLKAAKELQSTNAKIQDAHNKAKAADPESSASQERTVTNKQAIDNAIDNRRKQTQDHKKATADFQSTQARLSALNAKLTSTNSKLDTVSNLLTDGRIKNLAIGVLNSASAGEFKTKLAEYNEQQLKESNARQQAGIDEIAYQEEKERVRKANKEIINSDAKSSSKMDALREKSIQSRQNADTQSGITIAKKTTTTQKLLETAYMALSLKSALELSDETYGALITDGSSLDAFNQVLQRMVNVITQVTMVQAAVETTVDAFKFVSKLKFGTTPKLPFRSPGGSKAALKLLGALGPLAEIAGAILSAQASGAYSASPELEI